MEVVFHVLVLSLTAIVHLILSQVVSSSLFRSRFRSTRGTPANHLRRHFNNDHKAALRSFVHATIVSSLAIFSIVAHWDDLAAVQESVTAAVAAEISLGFWSIELLRSLAISPHSLLRDKGDLVHHVNGVVSLLIALWYRGITMELVVIRLLSQLSVILLIPRLLLLELGKSDSLLYLITFSAMIGVHFLFRIATVPWYWVKAWIFLSEVTSTAAVLFCGVSLAIDLLNLYWLALMVRTYWRYYPENYNLLKYLRNASE